MTKSPTKLFRPHPKCTRSHAWGFLAVVALRANGMLLAAEVESQNDHPMAGRSGGVDPGTAVAPSAPNLANEELAARPKAQPQPSSPMCDSPAVRWRWMPPKRQDLMFRQDPSPSLATGCLRNPTSCEPGTLHGLFGHVGNLWDQKAMHFHNAAVALEARVAAALQSGRREEADRLEQSRAQLALAAESAHRQAQVFYEADLALPQNPEKDETISALASMEHRMNRLVEAIKYYKRLVRDFPESQLVPQSHLAIGNIYFANGDWKAADQSYSMVLSLPPSNAMPCALYKQAWVNLRRGFSQLARRAFESCRKLSSEQARNNPFADRVSKMCDTDARRAGLGDW
jgi:tetratricopeptide (TPR) repeat protein